MSYFLSESRIAVLSRRLAANVGSHLQYCLCREGRLRDKKPGLPGRGPAVNIALVVEVDDALCGEGDAQRSVCVCVCA